MTNSPDLKRLQAVQALLQPAMLEAVRTEQTLRATRSLASFMRQAWHVVEPATGLVWGHHLDAICQHLEAVTAGHIQNLVISIPPGCTKSITVGVMWPAWTWISRPETRFLCASNDGDLVLRDAVAARRLIESPWYRERWGKSFGLTSDQNVKGWYENDRRGFRTSTTAGSSVTGKKGDILIVDDADDARKVLSPAERERIHSWWTRAFYNRVNHHHTARRVIIGQRVHKEDLIGLVLKTGGFEELRIPEEFNAAKRCTTSIGWSDPRQAHGELLRPERFGPKEIEEAKARLGPAGYSAQHQQEPLTEGGAEWPDSYFDGPGFWFDEWPNRSELEICTMALDPSKGTDSKRGDFQALTLFARDKSGVEYVEADMGHRPMTAPLSPDGKELSEGMVEHAVDTARWFQPEGLAVETNVFQQLLLQPFRDVMKKRGIEVPLYGIENTVNKAVRIRRLGSTLAGRKMRFRNTAGTRLLVEQLRQFPNGDHDDGPDSLEAARRLAINLYNGRQQGSGITAR